MKFRTPLSIVRGAGAAGEGLRHWWAQRLTAVALVPLGTAFVVMVVAGLTSDYDTARAAVAHPMLAALWMLFVVALFHHAQLGLQVIVEDYVSGPGRKVFGIVLVRFAAMVLGAICIVSILRLSVGG